MAKGGLDLDAELDHLYAAPPSEFTSARNALVKTLEAIRSKRASLEAALSEIAAEEKALEADHAAAREASKKADVAEQEARARSGSKLTNR